MNVLWKTRSASILSNMDLCMFHKQMIRRNFVLENLSKIYLHPPDTIFVLHIWKHTFVQAVLERPNVKIDTHTHTHTACQRTIIQAGSQCTLRAIIIIIPGGTIPGFWSGGWIHTFREVAQRGENGRSGMAIWATLGNENPWFCFVFRILIMFVAYPY